MRHAPSNEVPHPHPHVKLESRISKAKSLKESDRFKRGNEENIKNEVVGVNRG